MSKLILELQRDAMGDACSVGELLRKALVVAKKLHISDFEQWVSHELNGYPPGAEIPKYREIAGDIKAWNPYRGWIPVFVEDTNLAKVYTRRQIGQAIGSLEVLVTNKESGNLQVPFPVEVEARIMKCMDAPFKPTLHVSSNQVDGILHAIRNTVLNWALDLEGRGILGDGMSFTNEEKKAAQEMRINIANFQGILGDVQNSTVTQNLNMGVHKGDFDSLAAYLRDVGVENAQIDDLKSRLQEEACPQDKGKLGPKVSAWIGEMVSKAASGGWQVTVGAAGNLLAHAICLYYGF